MLIWGQTRCLAIETKRQQAAALQTLRGYQRAPHPRQRVRNHWDQRPDLMGRYGDRHVVWAYRPMNVLTPHLRDRSGSYGRSSR